MNSWKRFWMVWAFFATATLPVRAESYDIDSAHSRVAFSIRHLLGTARGEFHKFSGTIEVDAADPERSTVNVKIQVASLDTRIRKRDEHLLSADFFDAKQFPEIAFRSRAVKRTAPNEAEITGELAMHGVARPLVLRVKLATPLVAGAVPARTRWLVTTGPVRRKDFGLMFGGAAEAVSGIAQEVAPVIEIEAVRRN